MSKSKKIYLVILMIIISITVIAVLAGTQSEEIIQINGVRMNYTGIPGVLVSTDNNLVKLTTNEDIEKVYASMDPITLQPSYKIPVTVITEKDPSDIQIADSFKASVVVNEFLTYELTFPYILKDGKKQIVFTEADYSLIKIPNTDNYLVEKGSLLFQLNPNKEELDFYSMKETMGYSYLDKNVINDIEYAVVWAARPSFNQNGTKMVFYSERATSETGQVWVKDTVTGDENPIPNTACFNRVLQWRDDRYAYILSNGKLIEIDTVELASKEIYDTGNKGTSILGFVYPYLFIPGRDKYEIINVTDSDIRSYDDTMYSRCSAVYPGNNGYLILLKYSYPKDVNPNHDEAVVLDLETGKKCVISIPDNYSIAALTSYDNKKIQLNIYKYNDIYSQLTYFLSFTDMTYME
ncbi:MAG TPA: hypothetical protein PLT91_02550 [Clostridia bacterium]|nr:MAG: hypothetical protein BWX97_01248 [Firmicutes bacterium ADurb.Bin146]HOD93863.1 hypothetical protein [Clostridia bacterium]HQM39103.1 hypothetical protein [Clostridia bacterium]